MSTSFIETHKTIHIYKDNTYDIYYGYNAYEPTEEDYKKDKLAYIRPNISLFVVGSLFDARKVINKYLFHYKWRIYNIVLRK